MKKHIALLLVFLILLSCISASAEITVTDAAGRTVTLEKPAERFVSCYYISTASLLALGCRERIAGLEKKADTRGLYQLAAPELISLPAVGSGKEVNLETVLALQPDAVILPMKLASAADSLAEFGIPALLVSPEDEEGFRACVRLLGAVSGRTGEAEALLARCDAVTNALSEKLEGAEKVTVYMAAESDPLMTYPAGLYQDHLIALAGGVNAAGEIRNASKVAVSPEQLLLWDPEIIVIVSGAGYGPEAFTENEQFASLRAVREGRVYTMPEGPESWDYPTPSSVLGAAFLCTLTHPELYDAGQLLADAAAFYRDVYGIETDAEILGLTPAP
ncbi:MAG: ABC transporter substrate-binding protein [Clostridia bacterium]|nr:ABC transporter substrate-binding protein [Clostridia bacterium]